MTKYSSDPLRPNQYVLLNYIKHLSDKLASPSAVLNYISGARTWVLAVEGLASAFDTYLVKLLKRGLTRTSNHLPTRAPPLLPMDVRNAIRFYDTIGRNQYILVAVLLLGFFTLLRQSNLFYSDHPIVSHC